MAEVNGALYEVTSHLCSRLYAELATDRPGPIAEASWEALISITSAWREDPELPEGMRELLPIKPH
ncbi:hypothetical protein [Streptomyces sp.]|uniref:hypothetical protein n=1 Tax=Streptomyces sp. TaxID=1931 RepID=UPI002D797435|nr:hypothetical protein [Streptomyces sp.]HET6353486.1 hypothetical protein [Streptomyces sp.]